MSSWMRAEAWLVRTGGPMAVHGRAWEVRLVGRLAVRAGCSLMRCRRWMLQR